MIDVNIKIQGHSFSLQEIFVPFLVKPLFVLFIYYGMFSRVSGLLGLTGGMTAVLITAALFSLTCLHMFLLTENNNRMSSLAFMMFLFLTVSALTPLISGFIYNERMTHILRYVIELGICFAMFFSIYYFIREKLVSPKFVVYTFAILGGIASLTILASVVGVASLYRVGGDLAGLNYIGNTLAVSSIMFIIILNGKEFKTYKKVLLAFFFVLVFLTLVFTGTRAGLIAFFGGLFMYQVFGIQSRKLTIYAIVFAIIIAIIIVIISMKVEFHLFRRYTYESLHRMALLRFDIYYSAISDLTFVEFLFGRADLAAVNDTSLDDVSRYVNPHNVFLSLIRFNGIFPFIIFFTIFVILYLNYFKIYLAHRHNPKYRMFDTTMIVFLTISLINVMFSGGKFTRNFFLFFAIGYAIGYIDLLRSLESEKEYEKLII